MQTEICRTRRRRNRTSVWTLIFVLVLVGSASGIYWGIMGNSDGIVDMPPIVNHASPAIQTLVQKNIEELDWIDMQLLTINEYSRPGTPLEGVNNIVVHYIGNPNTTAAQNRRFFEGLATTKETYASSNFIIGLDGEIIQCVPVDEVAYCSNFRNSDTISIENCHKKADGVFTQETYDSLVRLTGWLCHQFGLGSEDVIRHYDITGKQCPKSFVDDEQAWTDFKGDVQDEIDRLIMLATSR